LVDDPDAQGQLAECVSGQRRQPDAVGGVERNQHHARDPTPLDESIPTKDPPSGKADEREDRAVDEAGGESLGHGRDPPGRHLSASTAGVTVTAVSFSGSSKPVPFLHHANLSVPATCPAKRMGP
jgi:hypothetical protein